MRYEIVLDGKKVKEGEGVFHLKDLHDYLARTKTLIDDIDYKKEEVVIYRLKRTDHNGEHEPGYGHGV